MRFRFPDKPTLTTPDAAKGMVESRYFAQGKYDGWRVQIHRDYTVGLPQLRQYQCPRGIGLITRQGRPFSETSFPVPPEIEEALFKLDLPMQMVLDGEFVGPRGDHPPAIYVFDCLASDGMWLSNTPSMQRREITEQLGLPCHDPRKGNHAPVMLAWTFDTNFLGQFTYLKQDWVATGKGLHLFEGIVLKSKLGKIALDLRSSQKSNYMWKLKYRDVREERF